MIALKVTDFPSSLLHRAQ